MVQTFVRIFGCCILALFVFGLGFAVVVASNVLNVPWIAYLAPVLGFGSAVLLLLAWLEFQDLHGRIPPAPVEPQ